MCKRQYPQTQKALFISPADLDVDCWAAAEKRPEPVIPRAACDSARAPSCSALVCWPLHPPCSLNSPGPYHSTLKALQNKRTEAEENVYGFKGQDNRFTTGFLTRVYYRLIDLHMHFVQEDFSKAGYHVPTAWLKRVRGGKKRSRRANVWKREN